MIFNYDNFLENEFIETGITKKILMQNNEIVQKAHQAILQDIKDDILGFYDLPSKDLTKIKEVTAELRTKYDNFVVLGIGGSALGNKALYNALRVEKDLDKKLFVMDNVDPHLIFDILNNLDLNKTVFNIITKSGTTAETMATTMIVIDILKTKFPESYKEHIVITTDKEKGFLRKMVNEEGFIDFEVPNNVGGRFSILTDVGLVSSAFLGIDIDKLMAGAARMKEACLQSDFLSNPAYLNGLIHYLYMQKGFNISVMMPYSNSLYDMADWYRQLWAESLGKKFSNENKEIFVGQTPVKALGTTDQHSQVQLYREGPNDKLMTLIKVNYFNHDYVIPNILPDRDEINYLGGQKLSTLLNAELDATEYALTKSGRPNCRISIPTINELELGKLIFMYEVQTVFTGKLMNINPLDQPGVEEGKIATYSLMGKKNFSRDEIDLYTNKIKEGIRI